ncbi:hypothetical protein [Thermococcus sp.]
MDVGKISARNERTWKFGIINLFTSFLVSAVAVAIGVPVLLSLLPLIMAVIILSLASMGIKSLRITCSDGTYLLIPDYSTSTLVLKSPKGEILRRIPFPVWDEKELKTPCGRLTVKSIHSRFGKVELTIKIEGREIKLP